MYIRIGSKNYSDVDLFVTHLQSGGGSSKQRERLKQLAEVVAFMKKWSSPTTPTILMGDMNINGMKKTRDYNNMLSCLKEFGPMIDANLYKGGKAHPTTFNEKTYSWGNSRLDSMFASDPAQPLPKNPHVLDIESFKVNAFTCKPSTGYCTPPLKKDPPKCTLSDHAGVEVVFRWRKA